MNNRQFKQELLKELKRTGITPNLTEKISKPSYFAYLNTLRGLKGLMASLHQDFDNYDRIEIEEIWIRSTECTCMTPFGKAVYDKLEIMTVEPIISCDFMHVVAVHCEDSNLLKYVEWTIEKHLNELHSLQYIGENTNEQGDKPKLKSLTENDVKQYIHDLFSNINIS